MALRLIVGLGNPGPRYAHTPHNVGMEFVRRLAARFEVSLSLQARFKAELGRTDLFGHDIRLMIPNTYMNVSGQAVGAVAQFYKLEADEVLVAYDEMAFEPGVIRLRTGGGHNGHNGIRDVIAGLGNQAGFHRLRIGVGHPGSKDLVTGYLTGAQMPAAVREAVHVGFEIDDKVLELIVGGQMGKAMNLLHAPGE
jgi:PTH1 family peptidyl-tRNA hydrolase